MSLISQDNKLWHMIKTDIYIYTHTRPQQQHAVSIMITQYSLKDYHRSFHTGFSYVQQNDVVM